MSYRSERFEVGELTSLGQAFSAIDALESSGLAVQDEVMSGNSYKRQLHPDTIAAGINANYVLQVAFAPFASKNSSRLAARPFIEEAKGLLGTMELPGNVVLDEGLQDGFDITSGEYQFGSTGDTENDIARLYPPWLKASWSQAGRSMLFLCGIHAPQPKRLLDEYRYDWSTKKMKQGRVVFESVTTDA